MKKQDAHRDRDGDQGRREFLRVTAAATAGLALTAALPGCGSEEPEMLAGTLDELASQGQLSPKFNGSRIFITRLDDGLVAFSLICSHKKCTVEWQAREKEFHCPCHEGKYDAQGKVIDGPPPGPLRRFATEIRNEKEIWVLNRYS